MGPRLQHLADEKNFLRGFGPGIGSKARDRRWGSVRASSGSARAAELPRELQENWRAGTDVALSTARGGRESTGGKNKKNPTAIGIGGGGGGSKKPRRNLLGAPLTPQGLSAPGSTEARFHPAPKPHPASPSQQTPPTPRFASFRAQTGGAACSGGRKQLQNVGSATPPGRLWDVPEREERGWGSGPSAGPFLGLPAAPGLSVGAGGASS